MRRADGVARAVALLAAELAVEVGRTVVVEHSLGVDTIALVAMVGALALGQELAGVVIGLMFSGGAALEAVASRRARRELTALVQRAPKVAQLRVGDRLEEVPGRPGRSRRRRARADRRGRPGRRNGDQRGGGDRHEHAQRRAAARDGAARDARAQRLGERRRAVRRPRRPARAARARTRRWCGWSSRRRRSGPRSCGWPTATPASSCPATLLVAGLAWAVSGDPVRALAVVVVATPCPLILAAPIALVSGLSRAARAGVIVKGAGAIETLGEARTVLFDKTGTLTVGTPEVREIVTRTGWARRAAAAGRLGRPAVGPRSRRSARRGAAEDAGLELTMPADVHEEPGQGIEGRVDGHRVRGRKPCVHARAAGSRKTRSASAR